MVSITLLYKSHVEWWARNLKFSFCCYFSSTSWINYSRKTAAYFPIKVYSLATKTLGTARDALLQSSTSHPLLDLRGWKTWTTVAAKRARCPKCWPSWKPATTRWSATLTLSSKIPSTALQSSSCRQSSLSWFCSWRPSWFSSKCKCTVAQSPGGLPLQIFGEFTVWGNRGSIKLKSSDPYFSVLFHFY